VTNCRAGTCLSEGEPPVSRNLCRYDAMVPCIKTVGVVDVSLFLRTAQAGDINIMKRLGILLFEISPCALGMAIPVSAGTQSETLCRSRELTRTEHLAGVYNNRIFA
jgi:hypothetical protein